jgi:predicted nucleotide-binding protein
MSKEQLQRTVSTPYNKNKPILLCGITFSRSEISQILIFESPKPGSKTILPNGKNVREENDIHYILECFKRGRVKGVRYCTHEFVTPSAERKEPSRILGKKDMVFIVNGRDDKPALQLQKYLRDKLKLDAEMFEDFKEKSSSKTIIEQLEYIRDNTGYAFVIATPDDVGCLREEMEKLKNKMLLGKATLKAKEVTELFEVAKKRTRQNVVFELGLFIGALGRDRVCCLLQTDTQEKPSDIDGILYVGFDKFVRETFTEITEKLEKSGLVSR